MKVQFLDWNGTDPHQNLALERYLLDHADPDACILLLWQNNNTVVIGRNQNPWKECKTSLLQEEGVHLARRFSGGGAVYHDMGNLNFSFICPEAQYDQQKQFAVIMEACSMAGIETHLSGRNDILVGDKKFSGNAFFHQNGTACHHGTLMICSNYEKLARYLTPSKAKLAGKGVDSVRSRVANLQTFAEDLTVAKMKEYLLEAFQKIYGHSPAAITLTADAMGEIEATAQFLRDAAWLYGKHAPATCTLEDRFTWGGICLELYVENGIITVCRVYTDSLDWKLAHIVEVAICGCSFSKEAILSSLRGKVQESIFADLSTLLEI